MSGIDLCINVVIFVYVIGKCVCEGVVMLFMFEMLGLIDCDCEWVVVVIVEEVDDFVLVVVCDVVVYVKIWVYFGLIVVCGLGGKFVNCGFVIDDKGVIWVCYDKFYMFDVDLLMGESWCELNVYVGGDVVVVVEMLVGMFGVLICYDLCFVDFYCVLSDVGVMVLVVLVVFMRFIGVVYWYMLLKVCVIEVGVYVIVVV